MITLRGYQDFVRDNWHRRSYLVSSFGAAFDKLRDIFIASTGLAGEVGEVSEILKKHQRDGVLDDIKLAMEMGDVLHYLTKIAQTYGFSLEDIMAINKLKLESRAQYGKNPEREYEIAAGYLAGRYNEAENKIEPPLNDYLAYHPVGAHIEKPDFPCQPKQHVPDDPIGETYDHDRTCPGD